MDLGKQTWLRIASWAVDTWGYDFRQQPPLNSLNLSYEYPGATPKFAERVGVYHGSELLYVFGEATHLPDRTAGDDSVAIAVMGAWISFAYYLSPNGIEGEILVTRFLSRRTNHAAGSAMPFWPRYNSSSAGELMVFEEQKGLSMRAEANVMRAAVYEAWGEALAAIEQKPPF